jgi:putative N-acetylmannosamine-6-phosphate epimerase
VEKIAREEKHLIAEGNYSSREDVHIALESGAHAVCIGGAISNVYKLTKKYTSIA